MRGAPAARPYTLLHHDCSRVTGGQVVMETPAADLREGENVRFTLDHGFLCIESGKTRVLRVRVTRNPQTRGTVILERHGLPDLDAEDHRRKPGIRVGHDVPFGIHTALFFGRRSVDTWRAVLRP